jgi:hypothetical protein
MDFLQGSSLGRLFYIQRVPLIKKQLESCGKKILLRRQAIISAKKLILQIASRFCSRENGEFIVCKVGYSSFQNKVLFQINSECEKQS